VIKWRDRFFEHGIAGLYDDPRQERPHEVDDSALIAATQAHPESLAVAHWSSRLLAKQLGIGDATFARAWRKYQVQPWRRETIKLSTDPQLEARARDAVGLYLNPQEKAIALCVDEKSQRSLHRRAGTTAVSRSPGPRPPRRSCSTPPEYETQTRDTSSLGCAAEAGATSTAAAAACCSKP
jgi:hypothetical protein